MRKNIKRALAALLAIMMIVPYAGCGKKGETVTFNKNAVYREEALSFDIEEGTEVNSVSKVGDNLLVVAMKYDYENGGSETTILLTDLNGKTLKTIDFGFEGTNYLYLDRPIDAGNGNIYFSCYTDSSDYTDPENPIYDSHQYIVSANIDGKINKNVEITESGIDYIESSVATPDGNLLATCGATFALFDKDLKLVNKQEMEGTINWVRSLFVGRDGKVYVYYYDNDGSVLKTVDPTTLEFSDKIELGMNFNNYEIYGTGEKYDLYLRADTGLYGYNLSTKEFTEVFNFIDSDVATSYFGAFFVLDDNTFLGTYNDWTNDEYTTYLSKFTKVDPSDVVEKETISLGCLYIDGDIRKDVIKFNKTNPDYRIVVKDYSIYQTEDDYEAGTNKMNSEIAAGQGPDIIIANSSTNLMNYAAKGLFVDLYKYMDEDPAYDRSNYFENVLKACEYDGKLVFFSPYFYINTLAGKKSILGDRQSWTFEEMTEFSKNLPAGSQLMFAQTREDFMTMCIAVDINSYVNVAEHKCTFDNDQFKALLTFVKDLPARTDDFYDKLYSEDIDYEGMYRNNKFVLTDAYLSGFDNFRNLVQETFGEEVTLVGYPSSSNNGAAMGLYEMFAISSKCKHPDGAWEFVKHMIDDDHQSKVTWGIPLSIKRFNELAEESMKEQKTEDYDKIVYEAPYSSYYPDNNIKPLTQKEVDQFTDYVKGVTTYSSYLDESIMNIIYEEAAPFFEGQKGVDEVATIIQSRVSIYLNEKN